MSVYDKAYELANALTRSPEYQQYLATKEKLQEDETNLFILEDYRRQQWEMQMARVLGQEIKEETTQEMEDLYFFLSANPAINEFLTAEYRLSRMIGNVQKIVAEAIGLWPSGEDQQRTHN